MANLQRAFSALEVKGMDDEQRVITGLATSPVPDRTGDVVDPFGCTYAKTIPLFLYHDSRMTVGIAKLGKPTKDGIPFEATLPKVTEPGKLKDRVDEAWAMLKHKLLAAVSIGFRVIDEQYELLKGGGIKYLETEILELSLVPVPMHQLATVDSLKSFDAGARTALGLPQIQLNDTSSLAALGLARSGVVRLDDRPPGASGITKAQPAKSGLFVVPKGTDMSTVQEQIAAFEAKRTTAMTAATAIMEKSMTDGSTLDAETETKHDDLLAEVASIDKHIARLKAHEAILVAKGVAVDTTKTVTVDGGSAVRTGNVLRVDSNLPKGVGFARFAKCLAAANGSRSEALEIAKAHYTDMPQLQTILKAAVAAGTTSDSTWAGALVDYTHFAGDFIEYLRPQTIIGKFGTGNIPGLFPVPFNIQVPSQTSGGSGYWVGQGKPIPLTKTDFVNVLMTWAKLANIAVLTNDIVRFSNPAADVLVRNMLAAAIIAKGDADFVNPSVAEVANVSPASITYGVTPVTATGVDADAVRNDVATVMGYFIAANISPSAGVWIMTATRALRLSLMRNALGQKEWPELTMLGGTFEGLPVIVSQYIPNSVSGGDMIVLVNASDVYLADDGMVTIDVSREASLQMLDNPTNASADGTATTMVSMFQTESIAMKAVRTINWKKKRAAAVQYIDAAHYGE